MRINFIIPNQNQSWAFPLINWNKKLKNKGLKVKVKNKISYDCDVIILTSRYYRSKYKTNDEFLKNIEENVQRDVFKLQKQNIKIIYYDLAASTGSRELNVIKYVDVYLKRQLYKDRLIYANNQHKYRPWMEDDRICTGCSSGDLRKMHLGWNLSYNNYLDYKFVNPNKFKLWYLKAPKFTKPSSLERAISASYRGKMAGATVPQRKAVMETLVNLNKKYPKSFVTGPVISKADYTKEVRNSKALVSPFGYGEICYRDMEAFIHGCILVKPDMEHVETFPNVFIKNETYIPTKWDLSDLKDTLLEVDKNYKNYQNIAQRGQELFKEYYNSFEIFYAHFISILNKLEV